MKNFLVHFQRSIRSRIMFSLFWIALLFLEASSSQAETTPCDSKTPLQVKDILIVIQSQAHSYHVALANQLKQSLVSVLRKEGLADSALRVLLTHEQEDMEKAWTVFPLVTALSDHPEAASARWILILEDQTEILSFVRLLKNLGMLDSCRPHFLGRALYDREPAIIHHFAFANDPSSFAFPDFAAGWLLSGAMLKKIAAQMKAKRIQSGFTIDAQHEIAKYIYDEFDHQAMSPISWLCAGQTHADAVASKCVTSFEKDLPKCDHHLAVSDIFFGVKTTESFHKTRLPVLLDTWGRQLVADGNMVLYSNVTDGGIPTVDCGVANTERGHCGKLYAIMKSALKRMSQEKRSWLVVTDDDTLMSVPRLVHLLRCYGNDGDDGNGVDAVALGEVYGYAANAGHGYGYLTGGGGFVLSRAAAEKLIEASDGGVCGCQADDSPDDMFLGMCLQSLRIPVVHRPEFHQARPGEYSAGYLGRQTPISFHRHTFHDPYQAYAQHLEDRDDEIESTPMSDHDDQEEHRSETHRINDEL